VSLSHLVEVQLHYVERNGQRHARTLFFRFPHLTGGSVEPEAGLYTAEKPRSGPHTKHRFKQYFDYILRDAA
jgi:hypothetical protein